MGASQPKKMGKATRPQIDVACLKARIHLELARDKKNNEIIAKEKELINRLRSNNRNRIEEQLIFEQLVVIYRYAQACTMLAAYADTLRTQANFLAQNQTNHDKIEHYLPMIYSLIFAANQLGLYSLVQFKNLMASLNNPQNLDKCVDQNIRIMLSPIPVPVDINNYVLEVADRNQIPLETINCAGHKITRNWNNIPSEQSKPSTTQKLPQRPIQQNANKQIKIDPYGSEGAFVSSQNHSNKQKPQREAAKQVEVSKQNKPKIQTPTVPIRQSVKSVNDLPYYPELPSKPLQVNPQNLQFEEICQKLKLGL